MLPSQLSIQATYCALCGVDLRGRFVEPHTTKLHGGYARLKGSDQAWLSDVRALRAPRSMERDIVDCTEIGTFDIHRCFGPSMLLLGSRVISSYSTTTLPVHDACFEILSSMVDKREHIQVWKNLHARKENRRLVKGCGMAEQRQGKLWEEMPGEEFLVTNPVASLDNILLRIPRRRQYRQSWQCLPPDFFTCLPRELLLHVLSFLLPHPSDLHNLRYALPTIFRLSSSFGNRFWRQVIINEMGTFMPQLEETLVQVMPSEEAYYFGVWRAIRGNRNVRNRRRIASLVMRALLQSA